MDPLPIETQRDSLAPTGERASAALTCASAHACGSVFAESDMNGMEADERHGGAGKSPKHKMNHDSQSTERCNGNLVTNL